MLCVLQCLSFDAISALWGCVSNDKLAWRVPTMYGGILTWSKQVISYILTYMGSTIGRYPKIGGYRAKQEPSSQSFWQIFLSDFSLMLAT